MQLSLIMLQNGNFSTQERVLTDLHIQNIDDVIRNQEVLTRYQHIKLTNYVTFHFHII